MTKFLLAICIFLSSSISIAGDYWWEHQSGGQSKDATAACQSLYKPGAPFANYKFAYASIVGGTEARCIGSLPPDTDLYQYGSVMRRECPVSAPYYNWVSLSCSAKAPVEPPQCPAQTYTEKVTYVVSNDGKTIIYNPHKEDTAAVNAQRCKVEIIGTERCYTIPKSANPKQTMCTFTARQSGGQGQGGDPLPVPAVADSDIERTDIPPTPGKGDGSCPAGTVNAGLSASGIPMCIGQGTDPKNTPPAPPKIESERNETLPDGSVKNTKTVTTTNTDLSKTTITTITITKSNGEKETVQDKKTTDSPTGKPGKETQPDPEKGDLCKQNPNLAICKNSSVSGKCGEISCMGDAIQCATLRSAAAMQCQQEKDIEALTKMPSTTLGNSILSGADPMKGEIETALKGTEVDFSNTKFDETGFLGGGRCLAPVSMSIMGRTLTANFDSICEQILPLRYLILALAYISAYLIVARSVIGGE